MQDGMNLQKYELVDNSVLLTALSCLGWGLLLIAP